MDFRQLDFKVQWNVKKERELEIWKTGKLWDEDATDGFLAMQREALEARGENIGGNNGGDVCESGRTDAASRVPGSLASALIQGRSLFLNKLDLGNNGLGDKACRALVGALIACSAEVVDLRLHMNRVGTAGAHALSFLLGCRAQLDQDEAAEPQPPGRARSDWVLPPAELHLSHNFIPPIAVKSLLVAVARNPRYPRIDKNKDPAPLWLRLEHQQVVWPKFQLKRDESNQREAEKMLERIAPELIQARAEFCETRSLPAPPAPTGPVLCMAPKGNGFSRCCNRFCERSYRGRYPIARENVPWVHLPFFWSQGLERGLNIPKEASEHLREAWQNWQPERPKEMASVAHNQATERSDTPPPAYAEITRPEQLQAEAQAHWQNDAAPYQARDHWKDETAFYEARHHWQSEVPPYEEDLARNFETFHVEQPAPTKEQLVGKFEPVDLVRNCDAVDTEGLAALDEKRLAEPLEVPAMVPHSDGYGGGVNGSASVRKKNKIPKQGFRP